MTSPLNREELEEAICDVMNIYPSELGILKQKVYEEMAVLIAGEGLTEVQYNSIMDSRKDSVDLIMRLFTAYKDKAVEEALAQRDKQVANEAKVELAQRVWAVKNSKSWYAGDAMFDLLRPYIWDEKKGKFIKPIEKERTQDE